MLRGPPGSKGAKASLESQGCARKTVQPTLMSTRPLPGAGVIWVQIEPLFPR